MLKITRYLNKIIRSLNRKNLLYLQNLPIKICLEGIIFNKIRNHKHKLLETDDTVIETRAQSKSHKQFENLPI